MKKQTRSPVFQTGFTLVELLVVLGLMSVIMLAMSGALRNMGQTGVRIDHRLAKIEEHRVGVGFLRSTLGRVSARRSEVLQSSGKPVTQFEGFSQSITWLGIMPAREGAGGRYFFRLTVEAAVGSSTDSLTRNALVVRFLPFLGRSGDLDWTQADWRVLVNDVQQFSIEYEDRSDVASSWRTVWDRKDRLPDAARILLTTSSSEWPQLNIPLRTMPLGALTGSGVASFGGGAVQ